MECVNTENLDLLDKALKKNVKYIKPSKDEINVNPRLAAARLDRKKNRGTNDIQRREAERPIKNPPVRSFYEQDDDGWGEDTEAHIKPPAPIYKPIMKQSGRT
jgi:hypothetical protein